MFRIKRFLLLISFQLCSINYQEDLTNYVSADLTDINSRQTPSHNTSQQSNKAFKHQLSIINNQIDKLDLDKIASKMKLLLKKELLAAVFILLKLTHYHFILEFLYETGMCDDFHMLKGLMDKVSNFTNISSIYPHYISYDAANYVLSQENLSSQHQQSQQNVTQQNVASKQVTLSVHDKMIFLINEQIIVDLRNMLGKFQKHDVIKSICSANQSSDLISICSAYGNLLKSISGNKFYSNMKCVNKHQSFLNNINGLIAENKQYKQ